MRLSATDLVCGIPAKEARHALRLCRNGCAHPEYLASVLKCDLSAATEFGNRLVAEGYFTSTPHLDGFFWEITTKGMALCGASFAPPLTRRTAERLLAGFVERCQHIETSGDFLFHVEEAWLFGSFARGAERPSDVDLFVEINWKTPGLSEREREIARERHRQQTDRQFAGWWLIQGWPRDQVLLFLKSRKCGLSLSTMDSQVRKFPEARLVYDSHAS